MIVYDVIYRLKPDMHFVYNWPLNGQSLRMSFLKYWAHSYDVNFGSGLLKFFVDVGNCKRFAGV